MVGCMYNFFYTTRINNYRVGKILDFFYQSIEVEGG